MEENTPIEKINYSHLKGVVNYQNITRKIRDSSSYYLSFYTQPRIGLLQIDLLYYNFL